MFFLILGIILGVISMLFLIQNTSLVTVVFFSWQLEGSLAIVLILALLMGIVITMLVMLPSYIGDGLLLSSARRRIKELESELSTVNNALSEERKKSVPANDVVIIKD